ncbi:MAG TPA: Jag N-terminal domain-containing protein, partial [Gammaproteobacteria bacterium]|nr:Jag N-terminal domain-containing protein [Gammaproteobacteria bacterium]
MDYVETEGDTIDQAIDNALVRLGVERERISIEILSEGKRGIFGFGSQKARVRASLRRAAVEANPIERAPDPAVVASAAPNSSIEAETAAMGEKARGVLIEILKRMGIEGSVQAKIDEKADEIVLEVVCDDSGLLIGR